LRKARGILLIFLSWRIEIALLPKWEGNLPGFADLIRCCSSIPWFLYFPHGYGAGWDLDSFTVLRVISHLSLMIF